MNNVGTVFWRQDCAATSQPSREASRIEAPGFPGRVPPRSGASRPGERPCSKSRPSQGASSLERRPSRGKPSLIQTITYKPSLPWIKTVETRFCTIEAVATKKSDKIGLGTNLHLQTCTSLGANITKIGFSRSQESAGLHSGQFCQIFRYNSFHPPSNLSLQICKPALANLHLQTWTWGL